MTQELKGSYILLIELPEEEVITIGKRPGLRFPRGGYAYVGSAMGGFKARLGRHLGKPKKLRWHIDYLLQKASIKSIILCDAEERVECAIARTLGRQFDSIPGFGSSDCQCRSHLFFAAGEMEATILSMLRQLNLKPRIGKEGIK